MAPVGFPVVAYGYASGLSAVAGTVALVAGALLLLDPPENVARWLVELWR